MELGKRVRCVGTASLTTSESVVLSSPPIPVPVPAETSLRRRERASIVLRTVLARPSGVIGVVITLIVVFVSVFASVLAPHSAYYQFPNGLTNNGSPVGPSAQFLLGTDALGRDLLSRLLIGIQNTMEVAVAANIIASAVGVAVGSIAGYAGRWIDVVLMRTTEVFLAVPAILLAGFIALVTQPSKLSLIVIIGAVNWFYLARIVRGEVLVIRTREFVEAATVAGASHVRIVTRHILPQVWPLVAVYTTLQFSTTAIFVASLSFVGVGIQPPTPSLGDLISDGSAYLTSVPRLAVVPGIALGFVVLGLNLLGDALRARSRGVQTKACRSARRRAEVHDPSPRRRSRCALGRHHARVHYRLRDPNQPGASDRRSKRAPVGCSKHLPSTRPRPSLAGAVRRVCVAPLPWQPRRVVRDEPTREPGSDPATAVHVGTRISECRW